MKVFFKFWGIFDLELDVVLLCKTIKICFFLKRNRLPPDQPVQQIQLPTPKSQCQAAMTTKRISPQIPSQKFPQWQFITGMIGNGHK